MTGKIVLLLGLLTGVFLQISWGEDVGKSQSEVFSGKRISLQKSGRAALDNKAIQQQTVDFLQRFAASLLLERLGAWLLGPGKSLSRAACKVCMYA